VLKTFDFVILFVYQPPNSQSLVKTPLATQPVFTQQWNQYHTDRQAPGSSLPAAKWGIPASGWGSGLCEPPVAGHQ